MPHYLGEIGGVNQLGQSHLYGENGVTVKTRGAPGPGASLLHVYTYAIRLVEAGRYMVCVYVASL